MSCLSVSETGKTPWHNYGVIATASLAAITVLVCGLLAVLVQTQVITLPSYLSATNLLFVAVGGGAFFTLVSLAIRFCCCPVQNMRNPSDTTDDGQGNTNLSPDGKGRTGAQGKAVNTPSFNIVHSIKKNLLGL